MAKFNIRFKDLGIYVFIVAIVAIIFLSGSYFIVDKYGLTTALIYSLIAYPSLGIIKYILLTIYWKKRK